MNDISTKTDIVSQLRKTNENNGVPICSQAADVIERLLAERDDARQELCEFYSSCPDMEEEPEVHAQKRGWDCYSQEAINRLTPFWKEQGMI